MRLKTLELGYTLPKVWVSKAGLQNVRVYTAMENLFTITDYKGYTPDLGMVDADGAGTSGGSGVMTRGCDDGLLSDGTYYHLWFTSKFLIQE